MIAIILVTLAKYDLTERKSDKTHIAYARKTVQIV